MILDPGTAWIEHRQQWKAGAVAGVRHARHVTELPVFGERADIDVNAHRVGSSAQAVFDLRHLVLERGIGGVSGRCAQMDDHRKPGIDGAWEQSQPALVHDDRVGPVLRESAQQSVIPTRIGEWPISDGMVQRNNEQRRARVFE